jgi:hypothetical protein
VRDCCIEDVGIAVTTQYAGSKDFYIADNVMIGREDRYRLIGNGEIFSNAHFRNNLFLGADGRGRELFRFPNATSYPTYDYNGYRPNRGGGDQYFWKAPRKGVLRDYSLEGEEF